MTNSSLINLETLIDDAKCFEILRQLRWPQGVSMLVTPGSIAYLLSDRFDHILVISMISSVFSSVMGTYLSYHLDISTGGSIVTLLEDI